MTKRVDLRVLALGLGVQSTAAYRMAALGELPYKVDLAIFADTQVEPAHVYECRRILERDHGDVIPILTATAGSLGDAVKDGVNSTGQRFAAVPFWCEGPDGRESPGRRQCTKEYKIDVVHRAIREHLGLQKGQRASGRYYVEELVGISLDESHRAKPSRVPWIGTRWPFLIEKPMRRGEIKLWLEERGFPIPEKSACVFCPFRSALEYAKWREGEPELFEEACKWDDLIRDSGTSGTQYVWRGLKPLRELPPLSELTNADQLDLFDLECEGMCGV